jgi:type III pantothenate kinase
MESPPFVLAIDIGNTRAKFGLFQTRPHGRVLPVEISASVLNQTDNLAGELAAWWKRQQHSVVPIRTLIAGSQPEARDELLRNWPLKGSVPVTITGCGQIPVVADVDAPEKVGIDRLLNVFAASRIVTETQPAIIVDSGTATTVDLMTAGAVFRGGSILPGLRLSAHAMHDYTARLPLLNVDQELSELPELPGRNTEDAMRAGLFIGQLGAVREIIMRLTAAALQKYLEPRTPQVLVTGGGGRQLASHLRGAWYIDSLPLHGLAMLPAGD